MNSLPPSPATKKAKKGRQKIEIKKVEKKSKLLVTFSKRKLGLFRKAAEISLLCDSEVAVLIFSQAGKIYSSGHPDPDSVFRRYLSGGAAASSSSPPSPASAVANLRLQYEAAMKELQEEKMKKKKEEEEEEEEEKTIDEISEMGLEDLEKLKKGIEELRRNAVAAMEKKKKVAAARTMTADGNFIHVSVER